MSKPQVRIDDTRPLPVVLISKNGRPVGHVSALGALKRTFPTIPSEAWSISRGDHSTEARMLHAEQQHAKGLLSYEQLAALYMPASRYYLL